ncbi:MAG: DUF1653 domain-containing protein [Solobacterium sp.]|nr:DUF1653 domain-containing protein [Erysipelotrichaceae bacterium]MBQ9152578.1 DUF1653 domain-containing protein [Solobacterium sp.]
MAKAITGRRYRHFKGNEYTVIAVGKHTETLEEMVVYRDDDGKTWIRPKADFEAAVTRDGKTFERFAMLKEE